MDDITRRDTLKIIAAAGATAAAGCVASPAAKEKDMSTDTRPVVLGTMPLGMHWQTPDPFLFCAHHDDAYPKGDERFGPVASLEGRDIGQDFGRKDGWSMYHGRHVPGFPQHPHRGFETVTIVRKGLLDHSDSLGAAARFGRGDVQWLTAGRGILHSEMFPLLERERDNPIELFQIWLNLPKANKLVDPHFSMIWSDRIPEVVATDDKGRKTTVNVIAGRMGEVQPPAAPPKSWASQPGSDVAIWTIRMQPGAQWTLPAGPAGANRMLYFFVGSSLKVAGQSIGARTGIQLREDAAVALEAGADEVELLLLQGRPIGEPVAQYGPFVMNTRAEIQQTMLEYQRTRFGGWPWDRDDPVHEREGRFARHADGRIERPA